MVIYRCLVMATVIAYTSAQTIPFYGDTSVQDYLRMLCISENVTQNTLIVLDNVLTSRPKYVSSRHSKIAPYLEKIHCSFVHYPNVSTEELVVVLKNNLQWRRKQLTLLFDLTNFSFKMDEIQFGLTLAALDHLYWDCDNCVPLLVLFNATSIQLSRWTLKTIGTLKRDFRSVLVPSGEPKWVIHIHPVLNGCQLHPEVFVANQKEHFDLLKVSFKQCNLNSAILNVSFNNVLPYCDIVQNNGQTVIKFAMETEILKILQSKFHFRSNLIDGKQVWGMFAKGMWTGVVGQVYNRTSDLALCDISQTLERLKVADYAYSIYVDELAFMSRSPNLRSRDWMVASPFNWIVWICNFLSLVMVGSVFYLVLRSKWVNHFEAPSAVSIALKLYAIWMGQSTNLLWRDIFQVRILYSVWILAVVILSHSYGGRFYSILTVPEYESPIDTVEDIVELARADRGFLVTVDHSSYLDTFVTSQADKGIYYLIGRHMARTRQKMVEMDEEAVKAIEQRPRTTLIASRLFLATVRRVYSTKPLHIGVEALSMDFVSFIFPKKSPLVKPFSMVIKRMNNCGLIEKLLKSTFERLPSKTGADLHRNPTVTSSRGSMTVLATKDLRSVYILWSLGIALSVVSFVHEALLYLTCEQIHLKATLHSLPLHSERHNATHTIGGTGQTGGKLSSQWSLASIPSDMQTIHSSSIDQTA